MNDKTASAHRSPKKKCPAGSSRTGSCGEGGEPSSCVLSAFQQFGTEHRLKSVLLETSTLCGSISGRIYGNHLAAGERNLHGPQTAHPVYDGETFFLGMPVNRD